MRWLLDLLYLTAAFLTLPLWLARMVRTGKIHTDWRGRFGNTERLPNKDGARRLLIHAVSVGEVNAIRALVDHLALQRTAAADVVIATTTDMGFARARALWGERHHVVRYPFDFSWAVTRFLRAIDPDVAVLVELEVWPTFIATCRRRDIPVCVVNGRLTDRSFRRYRRIRWFMRRSFAALAKVGAQDESYAARFEAMGTRAEAITITGTMKWDTAQIADEVPGAAELAHDLGIDRTRPLVVAGSTAPGEHELLVAATPAGVQLLCAPRKPEWFDQAARAMPGCVRRSGPQSSGQLAPGAGGGRFLLDTIGELRQAYALADVVVIGRSFGNLHGSDMMEPIALGRATVVGPAVSDFQETMSALLAGGGVVQTTAAGLPQVLRELIANPRRRATLAERGRAVIRAHQGASARSAAIILDLPAQPRPRP
jgi:3-deoxy-D-manno-octulosonic-acid transferase